MNNKIMGIKIMGRKTIGKRQSAERLGRWAETLATMWLRLKGYRLLGKRLRTSSGEIDLVMRRGSVLIFVEVKARTTMIDAQDALSPRGLARMRAASRQVMRNFDQNARLNHRFDALLIAPWHFPRHIKMITTD
jgi:putative endonuclease